MVREREDRFFHIHNPQGHYLVEIPSPDRGILFDRDKTLTNEEDKGGFPVVKRNGVIWKPQQAHPITHIS
jgi:hypothetical protein